MPAMPTIIKPRPGIQRDGTRFDSDGYIDGQWCRFQRGLPRKMGGYRNIDDAISGIGRGMHMFNKGGLAYVHTGYGTGLDRVAIDSSGSATGYASRTPSGFTGGSEYAWQFDVLYDAVTQNTAQIIAHATPTIGNIDSATATDMYIGDADATAQLTAITASAVSGGILALPPYLTGYGSDGKFIWSVPNDPSDFASAGSGEAFISKQKLIKGLPMRGGPSASPSGLYWALNALVRAYYSGGSTIFSFDTLSENTTILSAMSPIEYDGVYYWPGVERFMMFNGTVRELPNANSVNWFYDNLNAAHADKIFSFRNTRFGEIWWCFPFGDATEPTHAVIYNVRENIWYDTELPGSGRSSAISPQVYRYPLMTGVDPTEAVTYKLWQHEFGVDEIDGAATSPIPSWFETNDICLLKAGQQSQDKRLHIDVIEPDFVQSGDMDVTVIGSSNARAGDMESETITFSETAATPEEQIVKFKETRRQLRLKFESNAIGGDYQMGCIVAHLTPNGGTKTG